MKVEAFEFGPEPGELRFRLVRRGTLVSGGAEVKLTPVERDVLWHLLRAKAQGAEEYLSGERLAKLCGRPMFCNGKQFGADHVSAIREKLKGKPIETSKKLGYRLLWAVKPVEPKVYHPEVQDGIQASDGTTHALLVEVQTTPLNSINETIDDLRRLVHGEIEWINFHAVSHFGDLNWQDSVVPPLLSRELVRLEEETGVIADASRSHDGDKLFARSSKAESPLCNAKSEDEHEHTQSWETVRHNRRIVLVADAGYGKTTLLWHETFQRNNQMVKTDEKELCSSIEDWKFAFYLTANEWVSAFDRSESPMHAVSKVLVERHRLSTNNIETILYNKLQSGHCTVAIDGLDELDSTQRRTLETDRSMFNHPDYANGPQSFILASRLSRAQSFPVAGLELSMYRICDYDQARFLNAARIWCRNNERVLQLLSGHLKQQPSLESALRCPLLLRLACEALGTTHEGSTRRKWQTSVDLYEALMSHLLRRWRSRSKRPLDGDQDLAYQHFLACLARELFSQDLSANFWTEDAVRLSARKVLQDWREKQDPDLEHIWKENILEVMIDSGVLAIRGPDLRPSEVSFWHRSLGEFLYAAALAEDTALSNVSAAVDTYRLWCQSSTVFRFYMGVLSRRAPSRLKALLVSLDTEIARDLFEDHLAMALDGLAELTVTARRHYSATVTSIAERAVNVYDDHADQGTVCLTSDVTSRFHLLAASENIHGCSWADWVELSSSGKKGPPWFDAAWPKLATHVRSPELRERLAWLLLQSDEATKTRAIKYAVQAYGGWGDAELATAVAKLLRSETTSESLHSKLIADFGRLGGNLDLLGLSLQDIALDVTLFQRWSQIIVRHLASVPPSPETHALLEAILNSPFDTRSKIVGTLFVPTDLDMILPASLSTPRVHESALLDFVIALLDDDAWERGNSAYTALLECAMSTELLKSAKLVHSLQELDDTSPKFSNPYTKAAYAAVLCVHGGELADNALDYLLAKINERKFLLRVPNNGSWVPQDRDEADDAISRGNVMGSYTPALLKLRYLINAAAYQTQLDQMVRSLISLLDYANDEMVLHCLVESVDLGAQPEAMLAVLKWLRSESPFWPDYRFEGEVICDPDIVFSLIRHHPWKSKIRAEEVVGEIATMLEDATWWVRWYALRSVPYVEPSALPDRMVRSIGKLLREQRDKGAPERWSLHHPALAALLAIPRFRTDSIIGPWIEACLGSDDEEKIALYAAVHDRFHESYLRSRWFRTLEKTVRDDLHRGDRRLKGAAAHAVAGLRHQGLWELPPVRPTA